MTNAAEQIILVIGGKNTDTLCQLIAVTPLYVSNGGVWIIESFQPPVDIPAPTGVTPLPGQPPAVVYDSSHKKLITVSRIHPSDQVASDYDVAYYGELTFDGGGFPSLTAGQQLPGASALGSSLLLHNDSPSVISQDYGLLGNQNIAQPTVSGGGTSSGPTTSDATDPPAIPWTVVPFKSDDAAPSTITQPYTRTSFVPIQTSSSDVIVVETNMNLDQLVMSPDFPNPQYSFNAYSMPLSNFTNIQTEGDLMWSQYKINAEAPTSTWTPGKIMLSNPAPLVVPVGAENTSNLLYIFFNYPEYEVPFYYFTIPLSSTYSLIPDDTGTITATPQTSTTQLWEFFQAGRILPPHTQLPSLIDGYFNTDIWVVQAASPVMVGVPGGPSAVFVFFLAGFRAQGSQDLHPGICYASQQLASDGTLDPKKWLYGDKMIPLDLQDGSDSRSTLFSAVTVPTTNNWFPGPAAPKIFFMEDEGTYLTTPSG